MGRIRLACQRSERRRRDLRPLGERPKDGTTFPVEVSLAPLRTATGRFTIAVIRDLTRTRWLDDLAEIARTATAAQQEHHGQELLARTVRNLFSTGLSLQTAITEPGEVARQHIIEAVQGLDDTIREIRDHVFASRPGPDPSCPAGQAGDLHR